MRQFNLYAPLETAYTVSSGDVVEREVMAIQIHVGFEPLYSFADGTTALASQVFPTPKEALEKARAREKWQLQRQIAGTEKRLESLRQQLDNL